MTWADNDYGYKKKLTLDHTLVQGDETDFPILVYVVDADLADDSNGGHVKSSSGYDIVFYNGDEDTKLDHEIERYINTDGTLVFWVKVPSISSSAPDTEIYIYYGKTGVVVNPSSTDTWDANFIGVYHMNDASGGVTDSTSNGLDGVENGNPTYHNAGHNALSYCVHFDGTGDYFDLTDAVFELDTTISFEVYAYLDDKSASYSILGWGDSDIWESYYLYRQEDPLYKGWILTQYYTDGGNLASYCMSLADPVDDTWYNIFATHEAEDGDTILYLDGVEQSVDVSEDMDMSGATTFKAILGTRSGGAFPYKGYMNEFRVSDIARSANWVKTTFNTQDDPGNFVDFAAEEEKPDSGETVDDTFDISDSVSLAFSFVFASADDFEITDDISLAFSFVFASADDFEITDINLVAEAILIADTFDINDTISSIFNFAFAPSDTFDITDDISSIFSFVFVSSDTFDITDINLVAEAILIADTFSMDDHTSIWKNAFVIQSDTYTIYITKPEWRGLDGQIVKDIALFDFWNENYSTVDKGIDSRDRHLQGVESVINDISDTVEKIWSMQNNKEEVTITCLGETINGVYIIESFDFKTIKGTNAAYSWSINLKFVRDV